MLQNLTGWHALIVLAVIILVFGASKLPELAKSVGQSLRILKAEAGESATAQPRAVPASAQPRTVAAMAAERDAS